MIWTKRPPVPDEEQSQIKSHLKLSGIVKRRDRMLIVRNRIYKDIFDKAWVKEVWTLSWWDVTPRAVKIAAVVSTLLLVTSIAFATLASNSATQARLAQNTAISQQQTAEAEAIRASWAVATADSAVELEQGARDTAIIQQQTAEAEATRAFWAVSTADSAVATYEYLKIAAEEELEAYQAVETVTVLSITAAANATARAFNETELTRTVGEGQRLQKQATTDAIAFQATEAYFATILE